LSLKKELSVVNLKNFSLMHHDIPGCEVLKAIKMAIPAMAIEEAIAKTQTTEERNSNSQGA
jgi:hypothetical protein